MLSLGLMSGTSADGVSVALVRVEGRSLRVLADDTFPYPRGLRERVLGAGEARAAELCSLNFELGRTFARAAKRFLQGRRLRGRLEVAGSHGQTVIHLPEGRAPSTLQLGEPAFLAEELGVPVVSDFRPRDMAAGGEGAPLIPFFDEFVFGAGPARVLQNIGGIANASLAGRGVETFGFDTGPGNCLMDLAARRLSGGRLAYDRGGALALRGRPDEARARDLLRLPFFSRRPPKSLDRSSFGPGFLARYFPARGKRPRDLMATATYFTALSIADAYRRFVFPRVRVREAVLSGGGSLNRALVSYLRRLLHPLPVRIISDFGIAPLAKEPAAMALMAALAIEGRVNHCPKATGARGPRVLGKITPA